MEETFQSSPATWLGDVKIGSCIVLPFDSEVLVGALVAHVDDLYSTGTGKKYEESLKVLEKEIYLKRKVGDFRFCGKNVKQNQDGSVSLDQIDAIESLEYMVLQKNRRVMPNAPLNEDEKSAFRGLIGSLGWIARQTRSEMEGDAEKLRSNTLLQVRTGVKLHVKQQ